MGMWPPEWRVADGVFLSASSPPSRWEARHRLPSSLPLARVLNDGPPAALFSAVLRGGGPLAAGSAPFPFSLAAAGPTQPESFLPSPSGLQPDSFLPSSSGQQPRAVHRSCIGVEAAKRSTRHCSGHNRAPLCSSSGPLLLCHSCT